MTGKEKCKLLKAIRREIAETNGIVYLTSECTFEGECKGTCPKCDAEIRYLDSEINRLIASGKTVSLAGLSLKTFDDAVKSPAPEPITAAPVPGMDDFVVEGNLQEGPPADEEVTRPVSMGMLDVVADGNLNPMIIEELDLSVRAFNCLKRANINDVASLIQQSLSDMRRVRNLGRKSFAEVRTKLQAIGLDFDLKELSPKVVKNTIYGFAVADALGVPVEFLSREELATNPVTDYRSFGSHRVPAGTWSDDTSMTLATLDGLSSGLDYADIMAKFRRWVDDAAYTATNEVFDVGNTTYSAIHNFKNGKKPLECGCCGEHDNGNGSLMRIIPAVFYIRHKMKDAPVSDKLAVIHNMSALTHGHPRSKMACGIYYFVLDSLLDDASKITVKWALSCAEAYYRNEPEFASEFDCFTKLFSLEFAETPEGFIKSSGYVVDTLEAAVWCLLNTDNYRDCVLKAVNLGSDTDTVAAVAGGLAGCMYCDTGESGIPLEWMENLLNSKQIDELCDQFFNGPAKKEIPCPVTMGVIEKGGVNTDKVLDMTIDEMDFGTRTYMCLQRHGVRTVRDLTMMTLDDYMKVRNLGSKCLKEIESKLGMLGLHIAE